MLRSAKAHSFRAEFLQANVPPKLLNLSLLIYVSRETEKSVLLYGHFMIQVSWPSLVTQGIDFKKILRV